MSAGAMVWPKISHVQAGLRVRPNCATLFEVASGDPMLSACLKHPVDAFNDELLDLGILV